MTTKRADKEVRKKNYEEDKLIIMTFWMVKCLLGVNGHSDQYITNKQSNTLLK